MIKSFLIAGIFSNILCAFNIVFFLIDFNIIFLLKAVLTGTITIMLYAAIQYEDYGRQQSKIIMLIPYLAIVYAVLIVLSSTL